MSTLKTTNIAHPSSASNNVVLASDGSATIATLNSTTIVGTTVRGGITSGTTVASTSGTSIDFTGIPSWVKRITVVFNQISTSGADNYLIQIGSGSVTTSGYTTVGQNYGSPSTVNATGSSAGFVILTGSGAVVLTGTFSLTPAPGSSNGWIGTGIHSRQDTTVMNLSGGISPNLSGVLDRIRITTINGVHTFDSGSINILYEG